MPRPTSWAQLLFHRVHAFWVGLPPGNGHYLAKLPDRLGRGYRLTATADTYATQDGFLSIGANHPHQFAAMCKVLQREDLLTDPRFSDFAQRDKNRELLRETLAQIFIGARAEELEVQLAAAKVPAAKVRSVSEVLTHPHLDSRALFVNADVPGIERTIQLTGSGFRMTDDTPKREARVPAIGEDTGDILREIGLA